MQHFSLQLEAMSPLAIRADHAPGGVENAAYISGTTLLGGLAALHRLARPGDTSVFERLFLSGQVQYPDLYPASFQHASLKGADNLPVYPLPKTAQSCKRFPGFQPLVGEKVDDERHGARDSLLDWAAFALGSDAHKKGRPIDLKTLLKPLEDQKECLICTNEKKTKKPMDRFTGYYRRIKSNGVEQLVMTEAQTRLQTRTGINRATGTVQESILYSRQVFQEHTRFWGEVHVEDDLAPVLQQFIKEIASTGLVRIGTGRSRGMGKVSLALKPIPESEQDRFTSFKQRVEAFNTTLRKQIQAASGSLEIAPYYFALTLHSSAILRDDLLRFCGVIDRQALGGLLGIPTDSFTMIYQNASTRQIMGWNELWGTPRTKEVAIDTGSVFLFSTTVREKEALQQLLKALFELEQTGIGRRKAEGFGRICVSDQFHQEVALK
jgi:CRISPR-associated protein Csx10